MMHFYSILIFFPVLQMSSSEETHVHSLGAYNNKTYLIDEFRDSSKLQLIEVAPGRDETKFRIPICEETKVIIHSARLYEGSIFLHLQDVENSEQFLEVISLSALFNNTGKKTCIAIVDACFTKHNIYIYKVEESNIFKRWSVTSGGDQINSTVVIETNHPIRDIFTNSTHTKIMTRSNDTNVVTKYHKDLPQCRIIEYDATDEEKSTLMENVFKHHYKTIIVIALVLLFVLTLILVGYCFCYQKHALKNQSRVEIHDDHVYELIDDNTVYVDDYEVTIVPKVPPLPLPPKPVLIK